MTNKEISDNIIQWLNEHPALRLTTIEEAAGIPPRTLKHIETRGIPEKHISALVKELKRYGYGYK